MLSGREFVVDSTVSPGNPVLDGLLSFRLLEAGIYQKANNTFCILGVDGGVDYGTSKEAIRIDRFLGKKFGEHENGLKSY